MITFQRAIQCDQYFALAHYQLAYLYQIDQRYHEAICSYKEAIKVDSGG